MNIIVRIILNAIAVLVTAWILGDAVYLDGFGTAIIVALVLAFLNITIKPLMVIFTLPATVFSLGLFLFVINALVILATDYLVQGFTVSGFGWALLFSLVLSIVNSMLYSLGDRS